MCGWRSRGRFPPARPRFVFGSGLKPALLVGFALALASVGCGRHDVPAGARPSSQILRLSQRNEPADLDPAITSLPDEFGILRALLEGLLVPGPNGGEPQPGVAERFEVSADGLIYTFPLRRAAAWSNGDPVRAGDFVSAYRRLLTPATAAPKATAFYPVKNARGFATGTLRDFTAVGIRAADEHTLVVTLEQPTPRFPYYVASGPWLPVHGPTVERHGRKWTSPGNFVGNGPFTLAEWRPHQRIVVRKNPRWHGAAGVRLAEIQFVYFDNGDAEERAYRSGQIDATMAVPSSKVEVYARERPAELHRTPMIETRYLAFNTQRPPLTDERLRRALALAVDREAIVQRVLKGGQPATGRLVPPALRGTASQLAHEHGFDPKRARALLAAAGLDARTLRPLEASCWSSSQTPVLEAVQAMWQQELGLRLTITLREAKVHLAALAAGNYDIGFITAIPDVADAFEILDDFVGDSPENYPHWHDAQFDQGMLAARAISAAKPRAAALADLEDGLLAAAPVTPIYHNPKIWLMSPRVRGWQEDGLWSRCYHTVYFDEK